MIIHAYHRHSNLRTCQKCFEVSCNLKTLILLLLFPFLPQSYRIYQVGEWFNVLYKNELLSITLFSQALRSGFRSFTNRCQECKEQVWVQVFYVRGSRTTWKTCEVTRLFGSDNSSTYLPHDFTELALCNLYTYNK